MILVWKERLASRIQAFCCPATRGARTIEADDATAARAARAAADVADAESTTTLDDAVARSAAARVNPLVSSGLTDAADDDTAPRAAFAAADVADAESAMALDEAAARSAMARVSPLVSSGLTDPADDAAAVESCATIASSCFAASLDAADVPIDTTEERSAAARVASASSLLVSTDELALKRSCVMPASIAFFAASTASAPLSESDADCVASPSPTAVWLEAARSVNVVTLSLEIRRQSSASAVARSSDEEYVDRAAPTDAR